MQDERFEQWLRESVRSYNEPPTPDVDAMWAEIEKRHFDEAPARNRWWVNPWLRVAAALVIGVGLGRISMNPSVTPVSTPVVATAVSSDESSSKTVLDEPAASQYLGQAVVLLASLQTGSHPARGTAQLATRATDLLVTTRLLLDSPAASDPKIRALLEDLELVLAQVVQMPSGRNSSDLDLIKQAMEQRDVMPRLRTAVANTSAAE